MNLNLRRTSAGYCAIPRQRSRLLAFTLLELLLVIAIISLVISIVLPALSRSRETARVAMCQSNLRQQIIAVEAYIGDYEQFYPAADDPVSMAPFYWLWMGLGYRQFIGTYLVPNISAQNPSVLTCPSEATSPDAYDRTSYMYSLAFYHSPEQINALSSPADTYTNPQPAVGCNTSLVRRPADKIMAGEWASNHGPLEGDQGWWDLRGRRAYLFADGHAAYLKASLLHPARDNLPDPHLTINGVAGTDY
jgi:prepilin-type processing-associated H-X9-DG protein